MNHVTFLHLNVFKAGLNNKKRSECESCEVSVLCVCVRLKGVLEQMDRGVVDLPELRRNLELAAAMLDAVYTDETRWDGREGMSGS